MEAGGGSSMIHGFLKDPRFLASTLYLQRPEGIMVLLMVMIMGNIWIKFLEINYVFLKKSC